jgi:Predicted ATPase with chaperone activity
MPALVGGGLRARPGEVSLAHHGVLFLDELAEFQPQVLDALRQPLETGEVAIARANTASPIRRASCWSPRIESLPLRPRVRSGLSPAGAGRTRAAPPSINKTVGPLLDRIDLNIEVPAVTAADLILPPPAEGSKEVALRVARARAIQADRYAALGCPVSPPMPPRRRA